ncbi:hypothetical protein GCM10027035_48040 [Emticicia sediminis]
MIENRSAVSPLDWEQGKNDGQFVRIRIASSADIIPQKWQTKTEIPPPLLFKSNERWLCDWSDGDFEEGKFSIDDSGSGENYTLTLKFRSKVAPVYFQAWYNETLKKQQVCLELHDANANERVFNPFDVSYKVNQEQVNGDMTEYELVFVRSKLLEQKDRIVSVITDCENGLTKFVFASGMPELYMIACVESEFEIPVFTEAVDGIENIADGKYTGYAQLKSNLAVEYLRYEFEVKCNVSVLEILEIEEVYDSNLEILGIEEVTDRVENEGILVTGINI